jgi:fibronectin type 3 domain-containing protein
LTSSIASVVRADAPASLKATMGAKGAVDLSWPGTAPEAAYIVERASAGTDHFARLDGATEKTSYTDHSALPGHAYIYRVIAFDKTGAVSDPAAYPIDKPNKNPDVYPARLSFTVKPASKQ